MAVYKSGRESLDSNNVDLAGEVYEDEYKPREYLWGAELTKDKPTSSWSFHEDDEEEDSTDKDFLTHTLALKYAMLGVGSNDESHVIEVETKTYNGETIKLPLAILKKEKLEMMPIDLTFISEHPVEFRLVSGSGPVCLLGQHILGYPVGTVEDEESEYDTEGEASEAEEEVTTVLPKSKKRKANDTPKAVKNKKSKLESMETAELDDDENSESDGEGEEDIETPPDTVSNSSSEEDTKKKRKAPARKGASKTKAPAVRKETPPAKGNAKKKQRKSK